MAINRASLSDPIAAAPHTGMRRDTSRSYASDQDGPRRTLMVVGGFILALVSLIVGSLAIAQVWLAPAGDGIATTPSLQSWEAMTMILLGGVGFAAGAALVGIGMGRWTSPRAPESEADYTGPGEDVHDMPEPPRIV